MLNSFSIFSINTLPVPLPQSTTTLILRLPKFKDFFKLEKYAGKTSSLITVPFPLLKS